MKSTVAKLARLAALLIFLVAVGCAPSEPAAEPVDERGSISSEDFESGEVVSLQEVEADQEGDKKEDEEPDEEEPEG